MPPKRGSFSTMSTFSPLCPGSPPPTSRRSPSPPPARRIGRFLVFCRSRDPSCVLFSGGHLGWDRSGCQSRRNWIPWIWRQWNWICCVAGRLGFCVQCNGNAHPRYSAITSRDAHGCPSIDLTELHRDCESPLRTFHDPRATSIRLDSQTGILYARHQRRRGSFTPIGETWHSGIRSLVDGARAGGYVDRPDPRAGR